MRSTFIAASSFTAVLLGIAVSCSGDDREFEEPETGGKAGTGGVPTTGGGSGGAPSGGSGAADSGAGGMSGSGSGGMGGSGMGGMGGESNASGASGASGDAGQAGAGPCNGQPCECQASVTRSCAEAGAQGTCAAGMQTCMPPGNWGPCSVTPAAADTCAANNDDNCNGMVNEGCPCTEGATRPCSDAGLVGKCAAGTQTCSAQGAWGACSITPSAEDTCAQGNNDNCSGPANEGCICINGVTTRQCGICGDGSQVCTNGKTGQFGACTGGSQMTTYFRDADNDGHSVNSTVTVCGAAPAGYIAAAPDDCFDTNDDVFPGQMGYFPSHRGDGSFDYNCSGGPEPELEQGDPLGYVTCTGTCPSCSTSGTATLTSTPACGATIGFLAGCACMPGCGGIGQSTTQRCR